MDLERKKQVMVMNDGKTKKKTKKKTGAAKKAEPTKKKRRKSGASKRGGEVKKKSSRRRKKRNPGVDIAGSGVAALGGALAGAIAGPAGMLAAKATKNDTAKKVLEVVGAAAAPFAVGLGVQFVSPAIGKAMCAGAGAVAVERAMGHAAEKVSFLGKAGYRLSNLPPEFSYADGQVFRTMPDGTKKVMFAAEAKPAELTMPDGTVKGAQLLGAGDDGSAVVLDENGQLLVLSGVAGIEAAQQLNGIEPAQQLNGDDDTDGYTA